MHDKKFAYKLLKDKLKTGLSIRNNGLIHELKRLPSSSCDITDAFALYYPVVAKVDRAWIDGDMQVDEESMKPKRYKPNTPPAKNYPLVGKTTLVISDLIARFYGLEVPHMEFTEVNIKDIVSR